jgi:dCTP deaminase
MFLSDVDIKKALKADDITLEPFVPSQLQPVSYDIRLGNKFILNEDTITTVIDPVKKQYAKTREIVVKDGGEFVLHPGISFLAVSKEFFGSDKYLIQLGGKSSLARIGLMVHNTAGIINPGHFLHVTFEITNQNNIPIVLRPGMEIAQIMFSMISSPPSRTYKTTGRFAKNNWEHFIPKRNNAKRATKKKK